ncbi:MAG: LysR family transcriptional regulator [Pseudomonadota bacterium]
MNTSFDIDALRTVVSGIEQGSFARAAIELGRSQSAVSMQLKKLEHQAGVQLFVRKGRGLVPTDAGEALVHYARRIITLNDEAARTLGATVAPQTVRLGLPQDFYDDVMPATVHEFTKRQPDVHVTVHAGNNHTIYEDVMAGRLDAAIAFFPKESVTKGELLCELPLLWIAHETYPKPALGTEVPLVLFNHRCLFRQTALAMLDKSGLRWRAALTTPSLAAVWAALRSHFGIGVRVGHNVPNDIVNVSGWTCLPSLPAIELRLLGTETAKPLGRDMLEILRDQTMSHVEQ